MNTYVAGSLVQVSANFYNSASVATDPTVVTLQIGRPGSEPTTYTYGSGATIVRTGTGTYYANIDTTTFQQAQWTYLWQGTGTCQTVGYSVFAVTTWPIG